MKRVIALIPLILIAYSSIGQIKSVNYNKRYLIGDQVNPFPDSIRVDLPDQKAFVVFQIKDYSVDHNSIDNFNSILSELVMFIKRSSNDPSLSLTPHRATITFKSEDEKEITIASTDQSLTKLSIKQNQVAQLLPPGWEIEILKSDCKIYIYGNDLESIEKIVDVDFKLVSDKINSQIPESIGRKTIKAYTLIKDNQITTSKVQFKKPTNLLVSEPAVGFGFVADTFYPSLKLVSLTLVFRDRFGVKNFRIKLDQDYMLFTRKRLDGNTTLNLISGASLSLGWNITKNSNLIRWFDIGIGSINSYKDQTYFRGNTLRTFLTLDVGNNFSLTPEYYLTDNVTNSLGGLRLNYKFP